MGGKYNGLKHNAESLRSYPCISLSIRKLIMISSVKIMQLCTPSIGKNYRVSYRPIRRAMNTTVQYEIKIGIILMIGKFRNVMSVGINVIILYFNVLSCTICR